jgi:eukaryotic-like serine/threonine-protein kinase
LATTFDENRRISATGRSQQGPGNPRLYDRSSCVANRSSPETVVAFQGGEGGTPIPSHRQFDAHPIEFDRLAHQLHCPCKPLYTQAELEPFDRAPAVVPRCTSLVLAHTCVVTDNPAIGVPCGPSGWLNPMNCASCQTPNPEGAQSCSNCGTVFAPPEEGATLEVQDYISLAVGTDFGPRYHVLSLLGTGGMGKVYRAHDKELDRAVALKVLRPDLVDDPQALQRFKQELLLASKISHPNILRIHDLGDYRGIKFISMAFVEGGDLAKILKKSGRLSIDRATHLMEQLCEALQAAHSANVVHRDLKPQNILVDAEDHIYIADFGLAKTLEPNVTGMTRSGAVMGTPLYMSPEQVEGNPVDHRSDIYALGLIFYEMLTGALPFSGDSSYQLMYQRVNQLPKRPELVIPDLPLYLSRICLRCLEKDPAMRYQNAGDILVDLRTAAASSVPLTQRIMLRKAKRILWTAMGGAVLITALAFAIPAIQKRFAAGKASATAPTDNVILAPQKSLLLFPLQTPDEQSPLNYQAQGILDALSTKLSRMKSLHVDSAARIAQAQKQRSPLDVARELGANWMLLGTLDENAGKLRLRINLQEVKTGRTTWSDEFSAVPQDLLTMEDEICNKLLLALEIKPTTDELALVASRPTENIEAYDLYLRGRAATRNQRNVQTLDSAISYYEQALKKDSSFSLAYCGLSDAYLDMYAVTKNPARPDKALGAALQAEQLTENRPEVHFSLGSVYRVTGKTTEAVVEFKRALELAPNSDEGYRRLGSAYLAAGKKQEAVQSYQRAIEINPYYSLNYLQLGAAYLEFGDNAKALTAFQRSTELNPGSFVGYNNIGIVYYKQGKWDQCIPAFQKALEIQPSSEAYSNLGTAYFFLKRYDDSIKMYEKAVELDPGSDAYVGNLADAYRASGDPQKASLGYEKAIQLAYKEYRVNPRNADTLANIALYYAKKGDVSNSLEFIRRARAIKPDDVNLIDYQAEVFALAGHREDAMNTIREALKKGYPVEEIKNDPELKSLKSLPEFQKLVTETKSK